MRPDASSLFAIKPISKKEQILYLALMESVGNQSVLVSEALPPERTDPLEGPFHHQEVGFSRNYHPGND